MSLESTFPSQEQQAIRRSIAPFLTYLAAPYTHPLPEVMKEREREVTKAAAWLIQRNGWNVFSPITHSHPLAETGGLRADWEFWKPMDENYLRASERLIVLELNGWRGSVGVTAEIEYASKTGIPIYYAHWKAEVKSYILGALPCRLEEFDRAGDAAGVTKVGNLVRQFDTGATRDSEEGKNDYEGFFSPLVVEAFGNYMTKHRKQSDGNLRASDNWQKGIPRSAYIKSLWRHLLQLWKLHRGLETRDEKGNIVTVEDACCALLFNAQGYLFETLNKR